MQRQTKLIINLFFLS